VLYRNDGAGRHIVVRALSSVNPVTLVRSWNESVPELEDYDLQGFPKEEIIKSEILDMLFAV
jgi:hypothetical protein